MSELIATAVGPVHDPPPVQMDAVCGTYVCVTSTSVALLLPLLATSASPSLGSTATPSGVVPTESGAPIVPTAPAATWLIPTGVEGVSATSETVPLPELVTTARSRSVSTATPTGAFPTEIAWTTVNGMTFETAVVFWTSSA